MEVADTLTGPVATLAIEIASPLAITQIVGAKEHTAVRVHVVKPTRAITATKRWQPTPKARPDQKIGTMPGLKETTSAMDLIRPAGSGQETGATTPKTRSTLARDDRMSVTTVALAVVWIPRKVGPLDTRLVTSTGHIVETIGSSGHQEVRVATYRTEVPTSSVVKPPVRATTARVKEGPRTRLGKIVQTDTPTRAAPSCLEPSPCTAYADAGASVMATARGP